MILPLDQNFFSSRVGVGGWKLAKGKGFEHGEIQCIEKLVNALRRAVRKPQIIRKLTAIYIRLCSAIVQSFA